MYIFAFAHTYKDKNNAASSGELTPHEIRVEMPESTSTEYTYHSSGQVKTIQASGTLVSNYYDEYGFIDSTYNTNSGKLIYNHNAFRELTSQTDANGNNLTFQYDVLGRLITKTDHDGTTSYFYRSSGNGIGQIDSIIGPNDVSQSYGYDSFGRLNQFTERIPNDQDFATSYTYDGWGNNTSITYPSGITIKNIYTNGYLTEIKKSDNTSIWTLDEVNGVGQPKQFTLGNSNLETNFTYDFNSNLLSKITGDREQIFWFEPEDKGSLTSRGYQLNDSTCLYENFGYDPLDRLNITYFNNNPSDTVQYQDNGNISYRSGVGNYSYITHTNFLERITNYSDTTYTEDQNISYTANNMPSSISQSPYELQFIYGPDDQRIKTIHTEEGDTIKTKYFLPAYEKVVTDSTTREFNYIYSPYGLIAIIVKSDSSENMYYTETDHLGSIIGLINSNGTYAERYAYDAWGQRRNPDDWSYDSIPDHVLIDRGFTGHEHLDEFGLINMNGRMYDPYIGRFLSVDPFIQFPDNAQNFNGYAYCLNNPLSYTDPSGMVLEPRINPADAGYSFNPEAAAWLANYYAQSFGGGGGGSGGVNTVTGFWDSHASTSGILGYRWEGDKRIDNATGKIVGVRNDGHYEKVISQNNGTIHGNRLNNESDPNLIDEVSVEYKWVWDVPILSQSGFGDFSSRFSIDFQGDSKLTIGVQAGGNVGGFGGQYGIFGNLCSVTLIGNEGKKLIYPTSQQSGFSQINQGLSGGLIVGAGISHTFNGSFEGYGYANDSYLYLGWLSNKKGIFGITYSHSAEGNTINIGINLQIALILGFEGSYNLRIKW